MSNIYQLDTLRKYLQPQAWVFYTPQIHGMRD